jgi:hypothetical protein
MANIVISGDSSGSVTLSAPAVSGTTVLTLPTTSGTLVTTGGGSTGSFTDLAYTGTLTGGTGVVNLGSGQFYKDASGNIGIGRTNPTYKIDMLVSAGGNALNITDAATSDFQIVPGVSSGVVRVGPGSGAMAFYSNNSERMRIDSSGNVGIGTSSPAYKLDVTQSSAGNIVNSLILRNPNSTFAGTGTKIYFSCVDGNNRGSFIQSVADDSNATHLAFGTNAAGADATERMRIDSSGNLLVGITSTLLASGSCFVNDTVAGDSPQLILRNAQNTAGRYWKIGAVGTTGGAEPYMIVYNASNAGVYMGYGDTNWSSTSDESKKENLVPITDAITKVCSLRSVIGNFIADEEKTKHPFLIAQDVQKVLPEAVNEKDGVLGLKYSDMIPLLVAAIKEQQAIITDLKTRIELLEGTK